MKFKTVNTGSIVKFKYNGELHCGRVINICHGPVNYVCVLLNGVEPVVVTLEDCTLYRVSFANRYYSVEGQEVPLEEVYSVED